MEINLVTILLVIVALFVGYFFSNRIKSKQPNSENFESALKNYFDVFEGKLRDLNTNFSNYIGKVEKGVHDVSKEVVENKVSLNLKQENDLMKYPTSGIIGKKYPLIEKMLYLVNWLEKAQELDK